MNDETIMPDGRPLFAWRNEIEMTRSERQKFVAEQGELRALMAVLNIIEIEQTTEPHSGDYLIRVKRRDVRDAAIDPLTALNGAEVTRITHRQ